MIFMYPKITYYDPGTKPPDGQPVLKRHPLNAKYIPEPAAHSPEWGAFKIGLSAAGPQGIPPLVITPDGLIMDGKRRWLAARELQWDKVPCLVREEKEAGLIILDSLLGQRDLDRGTKAYIAVTMATDYISSAENRRLSNLKDGKKTLENPLFRPNHVEHGSGGYLCNPELADRIGVALPTLETAVSIFRLFHHPKAEGWKSLFTGGAAPKVEELLKLQKEFREELEPEILAGIRTIWQVRQAIAGRIADQHGPKDHLPVQAELALWDTSFEGLSKAAPAWSKLGAEGKEAVIKHWGRIVKKMPDDLREALKEALDA